MNRASRKHFVNLAVGVGSAPQTERHLPHRCVKWRILVVVVVVVIIAVCLWGASREAALVIP